MFRRHILPLYSTSALWRSPLLSLRMQATYSAQPNAAAAAAAAPPPPPHANAAENGQVKQKQTKAPDATPYSYAPFPARQNPFSSVLYQDEEKVLLAKSHYCLFTISVDPSSNKCAIYCPTTNELIVSRVESLWKCAMWMDERLGDEYIAGLVFPESPGKDVKAAAKTLAEKSNKRIVVAPDAWGITYLAFRAQQEVVRGVEAPKSLEHAAFLLANKQYDASVTDPAIFDIESGSFESQKLTNRSGPGRSALLIWNVLFNVHKRFGTPGSRKTLNPVDQIIRRVVKAVNIFIVDINIRVGKGTISEGHTMIVTIYDVQKRSQSVHMIRSLAEETTKLNALTTLLYGEGSSSISLFVPTAKTKASQLVAFARTCRPKSPFFVTEISSLAPYFSGLPVGKDTAEASDPRTTWTTMRNNCFIDQKHTRKDEEKMDRFLQRGFTALANKLFSDRLHKVSSAIISAHNSVPQQEATDRAFTEVQALAEEAKKNPVASITSSTFLNKVNINDAEVVFGLQQWKSKIYDNKDRYEREKKVVDSLRRYLVVDLETTTVRRYKRIANPFTKENFVVLSGARDYMGNVFMPRRYFDRNVALRYDDMSVTESTFLVEKSSKLSLFLPPLDDYDVLVGHNIKFDLLQIYRDAELRKFLLRGGKIWDTMYGEYLLTGHDVKLGNGAGLEDVAKSYGGQIPKLDAVKRAWAEGKETYEIPYATLTEYLHGDLENTELIFRKHMERALTQRQAIIVSARMDGLLCTTEMEYNGLKTNVELAQRQSNELVGKVTEYRSILQASVPPEIPSDCRKFFNWSSNQHLITFFFGGKLKLATNARPSKSLPGEPFARHELYLPPGSFPPESYPNGVFLRPPVYVLGIGDCAVMSGSTSEKGTRMFKAYFDAYMKQANFRKSSTMLDCLQREMVSVPRSDPSRKREVSALANLLPRRHLFLLAAVTLGAEGEIVKLFVKNPVTGESTTITSEKKGKELEEFIASQVEKHTEMILPVDENLSYENAAFVDAQVTIMARDAPFTFQNALRKDETLSGFIEAHSESNRTTDIKDRYTISLADTVPVLTFYKHMYPSHGPGSKSKERSTPVVPLKALSVSGRLAKSKKALEDDYVKKLLQEELMKPEEWCTYYGDIFLHIANESLQREAVAPTPKQKRKKKDEVVRNDDDLPVLLRQRRAFVGFYNALPDEERKRLSLMVLLGRTVSTAYDGFTIPCSHDDIVEINIKGRLENYVPNELEAEQVMRRFRSSTTRQLQVGEDTLNYFQKTHQDRTAATILELRGLEKLIGTYYESTDGGTGMVSLVHSIDSCIHHELIHNKTNTGRLASANPNCQNIPKEDKSSLRDMFISRYGEHGMCIEADYSQLEVVALAVLANDEQMLDDLRHNVDFHCKRVTMMRPDLKYTEVMLRAKKNKEPEFVKLRQQAKIFSFQRQYGAGAKMISASTGLTQDQVRMLIEKESETYRQVDVFNNMVTLSANNYDASLQNGARNVKGHQFFKGMFPVLTGSRYIFTESDIPESMLQNRGTARKSTNFSPTHLKNYPVQGFAGEIVQIMLGVLYRHFLSNNNYNGLAVLTNTVHDCVWVDSHESIYKQVAKDVERIMTDVRRVVNGLFPEMAISVDFPADVVAGENMGVLRPIVEETII